jgi:hypothetical protein
MKKTALFSVLALFIAVQQLSAQKRPIISSNIDLKKAYTPALNFRSGNATKDNFKGAHPCGVAISNSGRVAISTYEGENALGFVFIWNSFKSFNDGNAANSKLLVKDPEAVAFDSNDNLYISNTNDGWVYYVPKKTSNGLVNMMPSVTDSIYINTTNSNPRGLAFDANNNLYVMCENLNNNGPSRIIKFANPVLQNKSNAVALGGSLVSNNTQALGVFVKGSQLYSTDLWGQDVSIFNLNNNTLSKTASIKPLAGDPGNTLDVVADDRFVYFTNTGGYLVKWDKGSGTQNINIGKDNYYVPWGIALYQNNIVVADAAHNKVQVFDKNAAPWK